MTSVSRLTIRGLALASAIAAWRDPAGAQRVIIDVPSLIEFDACVLPGPECTDQHDVAKFVIGGTTRPTALTNMKVLTGSRVRGEVLSDLSFGPQRVLGPKEALARFQPGVRVHVRATQRRGSREVFVQSIEPPASAEPPPQPPPPAHED